mmetsp:Transcript_69932/g.167866  ORF Transcript_69932/g.167866 Transcript_69932/m.167866 type:complete len:271 (-) Transcript_69932:291-1103(-)
MLVWIFPSDCSSQCRLLIALILSLLRNLTLSILVVLGKALHCGSPLLSCIALAHEPHLSMLLLVLLSQSLGELWILMLQALQKNLALPLLRVPVDLPVGLGLDLADPLARDLLAQDERLQSSYLPRLLLISDTRIHWHVSMSFDVSLRCARFSCGFLELLFEVILGAKVTNKIGGCLVGVFRLVAQHNLITSSNLLKLRDPLLHALTGGLELDRPDFSASLLFRSRLWYCFSLLHFLQLPSHCAHAWCPAQRCKQVIHGDLLGNTANVEL